MREQIKQYIAAHWDECIHTNMQDKGTLIGLPYPYTVPAVGFFDEMYYWDTYFTNIGLRISGRQAQAKHNVDNMLYMVGRYGFMPNGNRTFYLNRSQPPFLSLMVRDVYDDYRDPVWLRSAYQMLEKEYAFWTEKRTAPVGLAHYDAELSAEDVEIEADKLTDRIGIRLDIPREQMAHHFMATAESGWDINPRWGFEGYHYAPVELNSLLYMLETNMAYFAQELHDDAAAVWRRRAENRRRLMFSLMENSDGLLMDYNVSSDKRNDIFSCASLFPLFAGLAEQRHAQAIVEHLPRLETDWGVLTCEKNETPGRYQWDYPNGWACLQYIAMVGLDRYGYCKEARRIAEKYVSLVEKVFAKTHNLWEKYNVVEGSINVSNEYEMPAMMGWSAGVYLAALKYLGAS